MLPISSSSYSSLKNARTTGDQALVLSHDDCIARGGPWFHWHSTVTKCSLRVSVLWEHSLAFDIPGAFNFSPYGCTFELLDYGLPTFLNRTLFHSNVGLVCIWSTFSMWPLCLARVVLHCAVKGGTVCAVFGGNPFMLAFVCEKRCSNMKCKKRSEGCEFDTDRATNKGFTNRHI